MLQEIANISITLTFVLLIARADATDEKLLGSAQRGCAGRHAGSDTRTTRVHA